MLSKWRVDLVTNYMPLSCNWLQDVTSSIIPHIKLIVTEETLKCYQTPKSRMPSSKERDFDMHTVLFTANGFTNALSVKKVIIKFKHRSLQFVRCATF